MITERLMKPGSFSVRLREDYPWSAGNAVDMLDHLVITPTRLDPISGFSDANILANAIYTGVITRKPSPRIFEGYGLAWWLGTPNGAGDLFEATSEQTQTMSAWVSAILAYSNGLTAGTLTNTGLSSLTGAPSWCTPREALDWVMRALGAEYRVNHDGTVDAAKSPDLFASASPTAVITRHEEGQDGDHRGLEGSLIVTAKDVDQYATSVVVVGQGAGATVVTESAVGSTSYKTFANGTPVLARFANAPSEASSPAASVAAAMLGQWNQVRRELSLTSRTHTVTRFVTPGDYVWVFDQLAELTDAANQIVYRGEVISPIKLRVYALTWPVQAGMGVYARRSGATPTYTDLTDFVEWETGEVVWDVGAAPRAANDTDAATAGGTAYLGANQAVAARAADEGAWTSWTGTTLQQGVTVAHDVEWARYRRRADRTVDVACRFAVTGSGTAGQAVVIYLPVPPATASVYAAGSGVVYSASGPADHPAQVYIANTAYVSLLATNSTAADRSLGVTSFTEGLAAGDYVLASFSYEAAS